MSCAGGACPSAGEATGLIDENGSPPQDVSNGILVKGDSRDPQYWDPHIFRDSYGSGMGIVWEAYHKGSHYWRKVGVPENPIDLMMISKNSRISV